MRTKNILTRYVVFFGLLIFLAIIIFLYLFNLIKSPFLVNDHKRCLSCHEMSDNGKRLLVTVHNRFACNSCHYEVDKKIFYLKHIFNRYIKPIKTNNPPKNHICLQCHSTIREITPPRNLVIPHKMHVAIGIECIDCHKLAAHGNLKDPKNNRIKKYQCLYCHNGYNASNKCLTCHIKVPDSKDLCEE